MKNINNNKGFTIVEVAFVLIIGGAILAGVTSALLNFIQNTRIQTTEQRLEAIDDAIQLFLSLNGRYPCAADMIAAPDTATFGIEVGAGTTASNCNNSGAVAGTTVDNATTRTGGPIRIGAVPVRTIGLPDDFIADAWGNRFTYAVTSDLALLATFNRDNGEIFVIDTAGQQVVNFPTPGTAHYVVLSHGQNSAGATPISGGGAGMGRLGCPAAALLENENCNDDAIFRSSGLLSTGANPYDDSTVFRSTTPFDNVIPPGAVMAFNLAQCPPGWTGFTEADGRTIIGAMTTNFNENMATTPPPEITDFGGAPNRATWSASEAYPRNQEGGTTRMVLSYNDMGISNFVPIDPAALALAAPAPAGSTTSIAIFDSAVSPTNQQSNRSPYVALLYCQRN